MPNSLGFSVYVSTFEQQKPMLEKLTGSENYIFTSFHIIEEVDDRYCNQAIAMCNWLDDKQFNIIADVSPKTLEIFNETDLILFAKQMKLTILRLDYGFSDQEINWINQQFPLAFNASTLSLPKLLDDKQAESYAMHNFYPRPETGLDSNLFQSIENDLAKQGIQSIVFISGDAVQRGPIFEGLPTMEHHRYLPPYLAYLDLVKNYQVKHVFVGDVLISDYQVRLITAFQHTNVIQVPVTFHDRYHHLYDQTFTIRIDSPRGLMRLQESRGYASLGEKVDEFNCLARSRGSITMDNENYQRYSGEIQVLRNDYPADHRVNVIGNIAEDYLQILECIENGDQIKFIKK
ncbi:hypothetical protein SAMN04488134_10925 [Amphibacillus marinus]|uniref:Outer surface protein n=1 Tax=Amphibacillus marinus TaxID=872970 RepID=A0A1H8QST3_9BACI|nr:MupG family TIM beta-alpha barrel fold protein [Amphibacillus marinus]SEO56893.1 hypothetical protein SAMN04488134_10925 [Amphibacillus marinus]